MLVMRLGDQTVYRLRGVVSTNTYNEQEVDWTTPDRLQIDNCEFEAYAGKGSSGAEFLLGRDEIVTRWQLHAPLTADITFTDRIEYLGEVFEVDGQVGELRGMGLDHKHCFCKAVKG